MSDQGAGSLPFLYSDFHGGFNSKDAPDLLTDDQARDLSNVQGTTAGAIVKRNGLQTFADVTNAATGLFPFEPSALGHGAFLICATGTLIVSINAGGAVSIITSFLTPGARWDFVTAPSVPTQGPLYGMNGIDPPQQWSGSGNTGPWFNTSGGVNVPNGKYMTYSQNQVFVAGVAAKPSRLYWSAITDPTNWDPSSLTGAGFMDFDPDDGAAITAVGNVGPYVLVCKPRKMWVLVDAGTATARRLSTNVGCVAHRSLASGPEGTFFLSEDRGVYVTNGSKLTPASDIIQPTIDSIQPALRSQCAGAVIGAHYYLSVPIAGSSNDTTLDYDTTLQSWWKHSFGSNQFALWHPSGTAQLYSAKATSHYVDLCFAPGVTTDNGTPFTWLWRGPWQSPTFYRRRRFPTPYFRKRLRQMRFDGSGQVDVSLARDFDPASETLVRSNLFNYSAGSTFGGSGTYGGADGSTFGTPGVPFARGRIYAGLGVANAFSVVFSGTNSSPAALNSYVMMLADRRDLVVA